MAMTNLPPVSQVPNKQRRPWLLLIAVLGCLCLAGLGTWGSGYFDFFSASREAGSAEVAYRAAGLPWEAKDLAPKPPVTPEENAAPLLRKAMNVFPSDKFRGDDQKIFALIAAKDDAGADALINKYNAALALATEAAEKPRLDFGRDYDLGPWLQFTEYAPVKSFVKCFAAKARIAAAKGDVNTCVSNLRRGWNLSHLVGEEPNLISMLVEIAGDAIVNNAARQCAALFAKNESGLQALQKVTAAFKVANDFPYHLGGEAYQGLAIVRNTSDFTALLRSFGDSSDDAAQQMPPPPAVLVRSGLPSGMMARAFAARHMQVWVEIKKAMDQYPHDPEALGNAMDAIQNRWEQRKGLSNTLNKILLPVFAQAGSAMVRAQADLVTTRALIAALQVKASTGKMPARIQDIPGHWIDPFTNQPLKVRTQGDSIRIYSVGADRVDNGGRAQFERRNATNDQWDVVAIYPPIDPKR